MKNRPYLDFLAKLGINYAHPGGLALTKAILSKEKIDANTKILDVGCGTGSTSEFLANYFKCHVIAVEPHPLMLEKARARFKNANLDIQLLEGSAEALPLEDHSVDIILAESVTSFTNIPVALKDYHRVLKEGGLLIQVEMTTERTLDSASITEIKQLYDVKQVLTEAEWLNALNQAGFIRVQSQRGEEIIPYNIQPEASLDLTSILLSGGLGPDTLKIWLDHSALMRKYAQVLTYRVYRAIK